jgi:hypothetical protein
MNPKIAPEPVSCLGEAKDYPRWTGSMMETLRGIQKFRTELERMRP